MKKQLYLTWQALVFTVILGIGGQIAIAQQAFASAKQFEKPNQLHLKTGSESKTMMLKDALKVLKEHYKVDIVFGDKTIEDLVVPTDEFDFQQPIEKNLTKVLEMSGLKFKKMKNGSFAILSKGEKKLSTDIQTLEFTPKNQEGIFEQTSPKTVGLINFVDASMPVKGKVMDDKSEPMLGVNVYLKGTTKGTTTNAAGEFTLDVINKNSVLIFSFIGFNSQEVTVGNQSVLNITMVTDIKSLDEVVVVGYGTQKRSDITGAVSKFKDDKLDQKAVSRLDQAMQGRIAGVQIQNVSAQAGDAPKITIRGISSVNAGQSPLIVVDGQPVPDGLTFVNPADVESVEVLKDAASAAIYGSRGASGVILITTKSGKTDKTQFSFNYSVGQKTAYNRYPILSTTDFMKQLFAEAALKATDPSIPIPTGSGIAADGDRSAYIIEQALLGGKGTDYQSESLRSGVFQNIQLSASGGKKDVRYFVSGGYQTDEGMMIKSNFEKINIRAKVDVDLSKRVKFSINLNPSYTTKETPSENFTNFMRFPSYLPVYHTAETLALVQQNAQWAGLQVGDYANPRHFSSLNYSGLMPDGSMWTSTGLTGPQQGSSQNNPKSATLSQDINTKDYRFQGSANLIFNILPGLDFKTMGSVYITNGSGLNWANRNATGDGIVSKGIYTNNSYLDLLWENTLSYKKEIKNHSISVLAGFTAQKTTTSRDQTTGLDYPSDNIRTLNNALSIDKAGTFGTKNQIGLESYLGRVTYAFKNKYLFNASFRADGSSYFGPDNKWGTFPAVSLGWVATEEQFLNHIPGLNRLGFRASYGVSGNNRILDFGYLNLLNSANYPLGAGTGSSVAGQVPSSTIIANPNITWESTFQTNFGLDLALLGNRINLSVDVYQSVTDRLLLQQSSMAFTGVPLFWNNIGSLDNKGFEIELTTNNIKTSNFKWTTSANLSHTENRIRELGKEAYLLNQGERTEIYQNKVGDPLVQFFGFKTDGVWLSQAQIDKAKLDGIKSALPNLFVPGGLKLVDLNGDGVIDNADRTVIGNPYPDFTWGITNTFSYRSFDLSFTFQGVQGGSLINGDPNYLEAKQKNLAYTTNR